MQCFVLMWSGALQYKQGLDANDEMTIGNEWGKHSHLQILSYYWVCRNREVYGGISSLRAIRYGVVNQDRLGHTGFLLEDIGRGL
jgi:hypothetical protein